MQCQTNVHTSCPGTGQTEGTLLLPLVASSPCNPKNLHNEETTAINNSIMGATQSMFNKQSSRYEDPRSSIIIIFNMSSLSNVYIGSKWFSDRNHPIPTPVPSKPIIAFKKMLSSYVDINHQSITSSFIKYLS